MLAQSYFPRDEETLRGLFGHATADAGCIVMQAGHFLLYYDSASDSIIPCISEELPEHDAERAREYGQFPFLTWCLGLRALDALPQTNKYVMIVVNDWQFVPKHANRSQFYEKYRRLPDSYQRELDRYGGRIKLLQPDPIKTGVSTRPFFGEMNLRNYYRRNVDRLIKHGQLPPNTLVRSEGQNVYCDFVDSSGNTKEVYCSGKAGDCSAEIAQMLNFARSKTGCETFINLYPAVCREFIQYGTSLAEDLFQSGFETVLNIGFPSCNVNSEQELLSDCEATLHVKEKT